MQSIFAGYWHIIFWRKFPFLKLIGDVNAGREGGWDAAAAGQPGQADRGNHQQVTSHTDSRALRVSARCAILTGYSVGCSDFGFFHISMYNNPSLTHRVQGFGNWQKKMFNFIHGLRKFLAKTGKCVFLVWFQSLILGASFDRSLPLFQHVLFMGSLIHILNFRSLSQKL